MKLCKDCKHNRRDLFFGQALSQCAAIRDPVRGKPMWFCQTERNPNFDSINECGSTGKLWERRKPILERFMEWVRK